MSSENKHTLKKQFGICSRSVRKSSIHYQAAVFVLLVRPTHWARVIWRQGEECEKHLRKHELLFSHKHKKTDARALESW